MQVYSLNLDSQTILPYSVTPITGWHQSQDTHAEMGAGWTLVKLAGLKLSLQGECSESSYHHYSPPAQPLSAVQKTFQNFFVFWEFNIKTNRKFGIFFIKTPFENVLLFISNQKISKSLDIVIVCFTLQ